jgi:hypothetical protein
MRRRRLLVALVVGLGLLVAVGAFVLRPRSDPGWRITQANYNRVVFGMSWEQVEGILGPAGDYRTYKPNVDRVYPALPRPPHVHVRGPGHIWNDDRGEWVNDSFIINIGFYSGTVSSIRMKMIDHGPLGNLYWRVKRQWQEWFP